MKAAVVAVTRQGAQLAEKAAEVLGAGGKEVTLYVPGKFTLLKVPERRIPYRKPLKELMGEIFPQYDAIICIMALGIVVRLIGPHLKDKRTDPAVLVLDEGGQHVISVLSGHWGGANTMTEELAAGLQAAPVITTATDVHHLPAIEMLAKERRWQVEPFAHVRRINAALVNGDRIYIFTDRPLNAGLPENVTEKKLADYNKYEFLDGEVVFVTNRLVDGAPEQALYLRPGSLVVGIGCRRGTPGEAIKGAMTRVLSEAGLKTDDVRLMASVDIKEDEPGLLEAATDWQLPVRFYTVDELAAAMEENNKMTTSEFVEQQIGVGGVCEPAAILGAGKKAKLIIPKQVMNGVTVAVAGDTSASSASAPETRTR
ncbi:cobalamin biosynthesis protein CbiG [bacterium]|nr:MAG: cobalamin biosynthesis protein CbiG [bacterium]